MPTYRFYRLNEVNKILEPSTTIDCDNDNAALEAAASHAGEHKAVEIWQERRLVGRVPERRRLAM